MKTVTREDLYFCYDTIVHRKLQQAGIPYLCACIAASSNRRFWLYPKSDEVEKVLSNK